jgi:aspartyl-tRNA(Asn)/glutamyl-tRNA(Gln) amidotransferase subunit B
VNVSIDGGERVEIKNVNSLKNIERAIEYELQRQNKERPKIQETRRFNDKKGITTLMRTKEQAADYRFISDPDLPIIKIEKARVEKIKNSLPETPQEKLSKLIKKHKIEKKHAEVLTKKIDLVEFFEKVIADISPKIAVPWVTMELQSVLNYNKKELDEVEINVEHFIELLKLLEEKAITELKAQEILRSWVPKSSSPKNEAKKQSKISGKSEIQKLVQQIIKQNPNAVVDYKKGNNSALNFLMGQVMRESDKRADFKTAREILEEELK